MTCRIRDFITFLLLESRLYPPFNPERLSLPAVRLWELDSSKLISLLIHDPAETVWWWNPLERSVF